MVTNYHIIDDNFLKENSKLKIQIGDEPIPKEIYINKDRKIYFSSNEEYDIMIIRLNEKIDDLKNINYLEIDDYLLNHNSELAYEDTSIYILHYPMGKEITVSYGYGITKEKGKKYDIIHKCKTTNGSSGSPILNLATNKLIGIHKSFISNKYKNISYNIGSFLKYPLIEMQKKNPSNRDIQFRKINYHKHKQSKIMEPQAKIETKNLKNINNEIPSDYYSYRQLNIKVLNNFNNEHFITDCKNFDSNTLNKQNVKYTRNISTSKISINNNNFYNNHNYTKSNFFLNKIPNLIANERTEENKYLNISYNNIINRINKYNKITYSKQKMLPNNMYNKNTNINNPKLNHIIQKKLTSINKL